MEKLLLVVVFILLAVAILRNLSKDNEPFD
jgi:hypothetical protein